LALVFCGGISPFHRAVSKSQIAKNNHKSVMLISNFETGRGMTIKGSAASVQLVPRLIWKNPSPISGPACDQGFNKED